ncbi:exostosin domain-containing protein [Winogradskyella algicola]|uniref:exostosin domain-containing protein n=1 Tax=Winogradskyella algicola TaxID=2575815 RepID=UPI001109DC93|nr:exostosin family protein [Winogradskyella algicola]
MKLFFPKKHYDSNYRRHLFALLKPFIKQEGFTDKDRILGYGISEEDVHFTSEIQNADFVILTMSWMYYKITKQIQKAIAFIQEANKLGKSVIVSLPSDFGIDIPKDLNVIVIREQGYKSKLNINHYCVPVFIEDPLRKYYNQATIFKRQYYTQPTVGFCGQTDSSKIEALKELAKIAARNILYNFGIRYQNPHQLIATKYLRSQLLELLQNGTWVKSNFIIRKQHRAGVEALKNRDIHKTTYEFFDNIKNSDYVLCVRGVGNFSVRLYETLAMGRIPIFVNTDCILPLDNFLNWKDHVVWVEYKDRYRVAEKVVEFHSKLDNEKLNDLFEANRKLWEDKLKLRTYFQNLFQNL